MYRAFRAKICFENGSLPSKTEKCKEFVQKCHVIPHVTYANAVANVYFEKVCLVMLYYLRKEMLMKSTSGRQSSHLATWH